ncbi:MAG: hypothetical protein A3F77_07235 [Betaproteobacteria bacterium RIFCSPLOWO2_12_FULL_67_28]|nr:MAG: hypothetical protein A3F77_07235 [Betaproteobacteria bacterium RIFCSPLOWO2_12_FULL_67_28]
MTELQLALLVIGALVVAGVVVYNRLQERGARRAAERAFRSSAGDALLDDPAPRREPAMGPAAAIRPAPPPPAALPDARIDYVVELSFATPPAVGVLLEQWKPYEHRYAKSACLAYAGDGARDWLPLAPGAGGQASVLQAGLQLVTREGAVGEAELIEFRAAVETLAAATGAKVSAPEMRQAVERARELDRFCADADLQTVFHVMPQPGARFAGAAVQRAAEAAGLTLGDDGRFVLHDDAGRPLFYLGPRDGAGFIAGAVDAAAPAGLSITFDVPRAPGAQRTFQAMTGFARLLATELQGTLVDDNDRTLDERSLAAIDAQLSAVDAAFAGRGIEPGGAAALRLFS